MFFFLESLGENHSLPLFLEDGPLPAIANDACFYFQIFSDDLLPS